jgi:hypothetical protein
MNRDNTNISGKVIVIPAPVTAWARRRTDVAEPVVEQFDDRR